MSDHLGQERRRFPRVTVPSAARSTAALIPVLQEDERSTGAPLAVSDPDIKAAGALSEPMLRLVAQAGFSLALWGGATFVAVRLVMIGAAWVSGRSGDALTT